MIPHVPAELSPYPPRDGNAITPWVDGVPFYARLLEVLRGAERSVWGAVSFVHRDFRFPDGTLLWDAFDDCAARGVDVRLLFWRNPRFSTAGPTDRPKRNVFHGLPEDLELLRRRGTRWRARWDDSLGDPRHCHHQKLWLVDVGESGERAFVGGMTLGTSTVDDSRHRRPGSRHDVFCELRGPAAIDVAHNFAQRWNEAAGDDATPPPWPDAASAGEFPLPSRVAAPAGDARVQITRTLAPGLYRRPARHPGASARSPAQGEEGIYHQYKAALESARRSVYIENQHPGELELLTRIDAALARGVTVVMTVPGQPLGAIRRARATAQRYWDDPGRDEVAPPRYAETFARLARLARHPRFTLAALAVNDERGGYREVYVHAKVCLIDDRWGTIGSANLVDISLCADHHSELNLAFWHQASARTLLRALVSEHAGLPAAELAALDDREVLDKFQETARENTSRRRRGLPTRGHCYALDPRTYAL